MTYAKDRKEQMLLTDKRVDGLPTLSLWSEDKALVEHFRDEAYLTLTRETGWFHQCNSDSYHMFEFWKPGTISVIREHSTAIAAALGKELVVELR